MHAPTSSKTKALRNTGGGGGGGRRYRPTTPKPLMNEEDGHGRSRHRAELNRSSRKMETMNKRRGIIKEDVASMMTPRQKNSSTNNNDGEIKTLTTTQRKSRRVAGSEPEFDNSDLDKIIKDGRERQGVDKMVKQVAGQAEDDDDYNSEEEEPKWTCKECGFENDHDESKCQGLIEKNGTPKICNKYRCTGMTGTWLIGTPVALKLQDQQTGWRCNGCSILNPPDRVTCMIGCQKNMNDNDNVQDNAIPAGAPTAAAEAADGAPAIASTTAPVATVQAPVHDANKFAKDSDSDVAAATSAGATESATAYSFPAPSSTTKYASTAVTSNAGSASNTIDCKPPSITGSGFTFSAENAATTTGGFTFCAPPSDETKPAPSASAHPSPSDAPAASDY